MPLLAGSLNFAWEVNALFLSNVFYGHVLWAVLDIFIIIHNVRFLEKSKRIKYLLFIAVLTFAMYGIFRIPNIDGQKISSFLLDLIMAVEYVLYAKRIAPQGRISVGVLMFLGEILQLATLHKFNNYFSLFQPNMPVFVAAFVPSLVSWRTFLAHKLKINASIIKSEHKAFRKFVYCDTTHAAIRERTGEAASAVGTDRAGLSIPVR